MVDEGQARERLRAIRDVVYRNLMESYVPFPIDREAAASWAQSLGVPRGGPVIIYTSYMYQLSGVFKSLERLLGVAGPLARVRFLASIGSRLLRPSEEEQRRASRVLSNVYRAVSSAVPGVGYLYEEEPYSGALLYELGLIEEFKEYGRRLLALFREKGVREIITVDPHTTYSLYNYRRLIGFDIPFRSYIEVVRGRVRASGRFVIHDSCIYSRILDMYDLVRDLARGSGVEVVEDETVTSRGLGVCCGGPLGPLDPDLSDRMARARAESLRRVHSEALVFCPLCYENLSPYISVRDFAEVISP